MGGHVSGVLIDERGRPIWECISEEGAMVLLPRVNAQNIRSGEEQNKLWAVLYMMYFLIYSVRNVCDLVDL